MTIGLNRIATVLAKLTEQANSYDQSSAMSKLAKHNVFQQYLFSSKNRTLVDCVNESKVLLAQIQQLITDKANNNIVQFQCNKLVDQCQAIQKALSSQQQRSQSHQVDKAVKSRYFAQKKYANDDTLGLLAKKIMGNSHKLYQELSKHHEYRQRFEARITQLNSRLNQLSAQDKLSLQQEILQVHKRLGQCNKAIYFLEKKIQAYEKGKHRF